MFALCIAMAFGRVKSLAAFAALVAGVELPALLTARLWLPDAPWTPVLCGALLAAVTVCAGIEAIVSTRSERRGFAVVVGAVFGAAFWSALQPVVRGGTLPSSSQANGTSYRGYAAVNLGNQDASEKLV